MSTTPVKITVFGIELRSLTALQRGLGLTSCSLKNVIKTYGSLESYVMRAGKFADDSQATAAVREIAVKANAKANAKALTAIETLALQAVLMRGAEAFDFEAFNRSFGCNFTPSDLAELCSRVLKVKMI